MNKNEITLKHPYTSADKLIEKLTMRRPQVKDVRAMNRGGGSEEEKEIRLFATLAGLVPEDMDGMDLEDYTVIQDYFRGIIGKQ